MQNWTLPDPYCSNTHAPSCNISLVGASHSGRVPSWAFTIVTRDIAGQLVTAGLDQCSMVAWPPWRAALWPL